MKRFGARIVIIAALAVYLSAFAFGGSCLGGGGSSSGSSVNTRTPLVYTSSANEITPGSAILNALINPNGLPTIANFQFGISSTYGIDTNTVDLGGAAAMLNITTMAISLTPCTTYHYRARANNSLGLASGTDMTFATPIAPPAADQLRIDDGNTPDIAVSPDGSKIYIVYEERIGATYGVVFGKSLDNGQSFTGRTNISPGADGDLGQMPAIAVDYAGNIHIVYRAGSDVYYARSGNEGETFSTPIAINGTVARASNGPKIAAAGNMVFIVWDSDEEISRIYMDKTSISAPTFGSDRVVGSPTTGAYFGPAIATDGSGLICVAWYGKYNADDVVDKIYLARSINNGLTFSSRIRVDDNASYFGAASPRVVVNSGNVYVLWEDNRAGNTDIRLRRSTNGGTAFTAPSAKINDDIGTSDQTFPTLKVDSKGTLYAAWQDFRNSSDTPDIYYTYGSTNNTQLTFSENIRINSLQGRPPSGGGFGGYTTPALAPGNTNVFVIWRGCSTDNIGDNIYLSK